MSDYLSLTSTAQKDRECTFHVVKADSNFAYLGILFQKGSPLKRKLNVAAAGLTNSGKKDRIFNFWLGNGKCSKSNDFYPLELSHFKNLFILVSYGLIACLCILVVSLSWKCVKRYREMSNSDGNSIEQVNWTKLQILVCKNRQIYIKCKNKHFSTGWNQVAPSKFWTCWPIYTLSAMGLSISLVCHLKCSRYAYKELIYLVASCDISLSFYIRWLGLHGTVYDLAWGILDDNMLPSPERICCMQAW